MNQTHHPKNLPLVSLCIPCYNAMKFLPISLPSIMSLKYPNLELILVDDKSTDDSVEYVKKNFPQFRIVQNPTNRGFAHTANNCFKEAKGKYFFLVNQDTVHEPDYINICVERLENDPTIGVIGGKIYKYDFDKKEKTNIIDTVGEIILANRRVIDEGQGVEDHGEYQTAGEVFAISGQNPIYRREALLEVAYPGKSIEANSIGEVFDEDLFMYKEDVDLGWRLRLFGWKAWYEPKAVAWHGRGTSAVKRLKNREIISNRGLLSKFQKFHSIKNRYLLMLKNEFASEYIKNIPRIWWTDLLYFGYNLIYDTKNITAYIAALKQIPKMWPKRRWIVKHRKVKPADLAKWFKAKV